MTNDRIMHIVNALLGTCNSLINSGSLNTTDPAVYHAIRSRIDECRRIIETAYPD